MKLIPLTKGQFALVDDEDYEDLKQFKWYANWCSHTKSFYAMRGVKMSTGKWTNELMHRRILGLERGDKRQCDHLDHATLDNRRANIRVVTNQENNQNRRAKGYSWIPSIRRYRAQLKVGGVYRHLGYHDTSDEARAAYLAGKAIYHPSYPMEMSI